MWVEYIDKEDTPYKVVYSRRVDRETKEPLLTTFKDAET